MITEGHLNVCASVMLSKKPVELSRAVYKDILEVLVESKNYFGEIAVSVKSKWEMLELIAGKLVEGESVDAVLSKVSGQKYTSLKDFVLGTCHEELTEEDLNKYLMTIWQKLHFLRIKMDLPAYENFLQVVREGSWALEDDIVQQWEDLLKPSFLTLAKYKRETQLGVVKEIALGSDSFGQILEEISKKYDKFNIIPSGIVEMDKFYLGGGFEPSRLYMFGGISGIGKSIFLLNCAINAALLQDPPEMGVDGLMEKGPVRVFLYITVENSAHETFERLYSNLRMQDRDTLRQEEIAPYKYRQSVQDSIQSILDQHNSNLHIFYRPAGTMTPLDIEHLTDTINEDNTVGKVKAIYVDYLDKLKPDIRSQHRWVEIGEIAEGLKSLAIKFEIPVITATQLNTKAYISGGAGAEAMSESMMKVHVTDFLAFLVSPQEEGNETGDLSLKEAIASSGGEDSGYNRVLLKFIKSRNTRSGGKMDIYIDGAKAKVLTKGQLDKASSLARLGPPEKVEIPKVEFYGANL